MHISIGRTFANRLQHLHEFPGGDALACRANDVASAYRPRHRPLAWTWTCRFSPTPTQESDHAPCDSRSAQVDMSEKNIRLEILIAQFKLDLSFILADLCPELSSPRGRKC